MTDTEESSAQRQARIRREKREKKILEGGTSRLEKISGVSGRSIALESPVSTPKSGLSGGETPPPPSTSNEPRPALAPAEPPSSSFALRRSATPDEPVDPQQQDLMRELQKLLSGAGGSSGSVPPSGTEPGLADNLQAGLPPGLANLFSSGPVAPEAPARASYQWKVLHLISSLALGAYILWAYAFTGADRFTQWDAAGMPQNRADGSPLNYAGADAAPINFSSLKNDRITVFSLFASVELALQSARFLLDDRSAESAGMIGTVAGFLPQPWGQRLRLMNRYIGIGSTLVADGMIVVFVLGIGAWWNGAEA